MLTLIMTMTEAPDDRAFLEEIYLEYRKLMYWTVQKYMEQEQDCEDVVHDSLICLMQKTHKLRQMNRAELAGYISVTVRNTAYNRLKREKLYREKTAVVDPLLLAPDHEAEDTISRLDDAALLRALGQKMTPQERLLLEGKFLLEKSDRELAALLHCKPESLRMKLTRLRRSLRVYQQELEGGGTDEHF